MAHPGFEDAATAPNASDLGEFDVVDVLEWALHKLIERDCATKDEVMFAVEDAMSELRDDGALQDMKRIHLLLNSVNSTLARPH